MHTYARALTNNVVTRKFEISLQRFERREANSLFTVFMCAAILAVLHFAVFILGPLAPTHITFWAAVVVGSLAAVVIVHSRHPNFYACPDGSISWTFVVGAWLFLSVVSTGAGVIIAAILATR